MSWVEAKPGLHRWKPAPGCVYYCERINYRSRQYFARCNGMSMLTGRGKMFRGTLEQCQAKCAAHFGANRRDEA